MCIKYYLGGSYVLLISLILFLFLSAPPPSRSQIFVGEMRKVDESGIEIVDILASREKIMTVLVDELWPQTAKQDRTCREFLFRVKNSRDRHQMADRVYIGSRRSV